MRYLLLIALLILGGCATSGGYIPISAVSIDEETGEMVTSIAGYTKDASIAKEMALLNTYAIAYNNKREMYKVSGTQITGWQTMKGPDGVMMMLPLMTMREAPHFENILPKEPSRHPVWESVNHGMSVVARAGLIGWGLSELSGVLKAGYDSAGAVYNGDANFTNSFNTAGSSQTFSATNPYIGQPPTQSSEWYMGIPGCSSEESFLAGRCSVKP